MCGATWRTFVAPASDPTDPDAGDHHVSGHETVVIADTGPPHYLVLIGAVDLLPALFGVVVVPDAVLAELGRPRTPAPVRAWAGAHPSWLLPRPTAPIASLPHPDLGDGERAAMALARDVRAARAPVLLLIDDRAAVQAARAEGFQVTGTIGVLLRAARKDLIDLSVAFVALRATNFHCSPALLDALLAEHLHRGSLP